MSATNQSPDEPQVSQPTNTPREFTDWHNNLDPEPTRAEERAAHKDTMAMGNVTSVGPNENGNRSAEYDRLDSHNRDNIWKYRVDSAISESADTQFKRGTMLAFGYQVSLSPLQRQIALDRFFALDLPRCGQRIELVAFCVCAVVLNEDVEGYFNEDKPYYPTRKDENNHSELLTLQNRLMERWEAITESRIHSMFQKVSQRSLPTTTESDSQSAHLGGDQVQKRPSYCPDWALPRPT
jgi:hypothetical protein